MHGLEWLGPESVAYVGFALTGMAFAVGRRQKAETVRKRRRRRRRFVAPRPDATLSHLVKIYHSGALDWILDNKLRRKSLRTCYRHQQVVRGGNAGGINKQENKGKLHSLEHLRK